jgi:hypothetical protein
MIDAKRYQVGFYGQPVSQKSPGKNRHLQRHLFVPDKVFSCVQSNILLSRQKLISTTNWVTAGRVKLPLPRIGNLTLQWESWNKVWHSPNISSFHIFNCLLYTHASPPPPHPKAYILAIVLDFDSTKSNKRLNLSIKEITPNQRLVQKKSICPVPHLLRDALPEPPSP